MKNVGEVASARQKQAKKRSLRVVNEHLIRFAPPFGAVLKHVQLVAVSLFLTPRWQRTTAWMQEVGRRRKPKRRYFFNGLLKQRHLIPPCTRQLGQIHQARQTLLQLPMKQAGQFRGAVIIRSMQEHVRLLARLYPLRDLVQPGL